MLKRAHRARVNVDIRIQFEEGYLVRAWHSGEEAAAIPLPREDTTPPVTGTMRHGTHQSEKLPDAYFHVSRDRLSDGRSV